MRCFELVDMGLMSQLTARGCNVDVFLLFNNPLSANLQCLFTVMPKFMSFPDVLIVWETLVFSAEDTSFQ